MRHYKPASVIGYCDRSKFSGGTYTRLDLSKVRQTRPTKHWYNIHTGTHITDNLLRQRGFDQLFGTAYGKGTPNEELMLMSGFVTVYDCGQSTYVWEDAEK